MIAILSHIKITVKKKKGTMKNKKRHTSAGNTGILAVDLHAVYVSGLLKPRGIRMPDVVGVHVVVVLDLAHHVLLLIVIARMVVIVMTVPLTGHFGRRHGTVDAGHGPEHPSHGVSVLHATRTRVHVLGWHRHRHGWMHHQARGWPMLEVHGVVLQSHVVGALALVSTVLGATLHHHVVVEHVSLHLELAVVGRFGVVQGVLATVVPGRQTATGLRALGFQDLIRTVLCRAVLTHQF